MNTNSARLQDFSSVGNGLQTWRRCKFEVMDDTFHFVKIHTSRNPADTGMIYSLLVVSLRADGSRAHLICSLTTL
jgi:hypothetical protein